VLLHAARTTAEIAIAAAAKALFLDLNMWGASVWGMRIVWYLALSLARSGCWCAR
jgi:hypothetical protein